MDALKLAAAVALALLSAIAQPDPWSTLRFFEGKWEGAASGEPGKGSSTREYRFDLNARFLSVRTRSVWDAKPGAKPEVHEDFGMFSYDRLQKKLVLRQFHVEGFVNEYIADPPAAEATSFSFTTVRIENFRDGFRAREAYRILSPDEFVETFSLAEPGKDFEVYSETRFRRVK